jgi:N-methylhydantoinase B
MSVEIAETTADRADDSPITLELLRTQLQAIADEAADTIERTAISPIVTEGQDYGAVLMRANGSMLVGGGLAVFQWVAARHAVQATMAKFGDGIRDGDVYIANDPHHGGGLHPPDVIVQRPVFVDGELAAWAASSAHLMDMGGMAVGSWSIEATECYQEAFRLPPVRVIREGEEVEDLWDVLRINVRFSEIMEMDLRGLIAGTYVAARKLQDLVRDTGGVAVFAQRADGLLETTRRAMAERISLLEDGTYCSVMWTEWGRELLPTPCELTVRGDRMSFDFAGSAEQVPFFINSKPYIIMSQFLSLVASSLGRDLPCNDGLLAQVDLHCPEGTVVNSLPPAPGTCGHMHLANNAAETMNQCLRLAIWSSPKVQDLVHLAGYDAASGHSANTFWGPGIGGELDVWMMLDGLMLGQAASPSLDGVDFTVRPVFLPGKTVTQQTPLDVESYERWYPMLMESRTLQSGTYGAGQWRAGGALSYTFSARGEVEIGGSMLGQKGIVPLPGIGGGRPGSVTEFELVSATGERTAIGMSDPGVVIRQGEMFTLRNSSGGGWGDPLERHPGAVETDVVEGRYTEVEAESAYGVVLAGGVVDEAATSELRDRLRAGRLAAAEPAPSPVDRPALGPAELGEATAHFVEVVQRNGIAYAAASGAALAVAPGEWTEGCPRLREQAADGLVDVVTYLDPSTGRALYTDVSAAGWGRSFVARTDAWSGGPA